MRVRLVSAQVFESNLAVEIGTATLTLTGDLDESVLRLLERDLERALARIPERVVLNVDRLRSMSPSATRALLFMRQRLPFAEGDSIYVVGASEEIPAGVSRRRRRPAGARPRRAGADRVATRASWGEPQPAGSPHGHSGYGRHLPDVGSGSFRCGAKSRAAIVDAASSRRRGRRTRARTSCGRRGRGRGRRLSVIVPNVTPVGISRVVSRW